MTHIIAPPEADERIRRQWQLSFDMTGQGIAVVVPETGGMERVNPAFARMHGGVPGDFTGRPISSTLTEEWRSRVDELERTIHEQGSLRFECERVRLDGSVFPAEVEVVAAREPTGELLYRLAFVTDLTELRAREASERLAVEQFECAFEDAPVGMILMRAGRIERVNGAAGTVLGREPPDLIGFDPAGLVHSGDLVATDLARSALADGRTPPPQDRRIVRPDRRVVHARLHFSLLHETGAADGPLALVLITDRTPEVEAEEARTAALSLFSTAVDQAPSGMALVGLDGRFLRVNAALCRLFGRTEPNLLATTFQELTHPHDLDVDIALMHECLEGKRDHYQIPKRYLRPDGEVVHAYLSGSVIRTKSGEPDHFVAQVMDLTQLHTAEEQLRLIDDRDRIARALHDSCIQRLFAVGLALQGLAAALPEPSHVQRLESAVTDIDRTIKGMRSVIYGLRAPGSGGGTGVRDRVVRILEDVTPALGHPPQLRLSGPLEVALPEDLVAELLAALRGVLAGDGADVRATRTDVALTVDPRSSWVELEVADDRRGPTGPQRAASLADLARIARQRGGSCDVQVPAAEHSSGTGTRVCCRLPIA